RRPGPLAMAGVAQLVRAPDCGSGCRGFDPHPSPHSSAGARAGRAPASSAAARMQNDAILFANESFYRAFAARDAAAMEALWATDLPVACVHPGWAPLTDRAAVMQSWRNILSNANAPKVVCRSPRLFHYGDVAAVVCFEMIEGQFLVATNLFVRQGNAWKMVHHQAGPTAEAPQE